MRRVAIALALVIVFAALCVPLVAPPPPAPAPVLDELSGGAASRAGASLAAVDAPGSIDELRARIAAVLTREGIPGVGIALVDRDGPIWVGGVGVADVETGRPVDADTVFRVASITKSIVGLGVMRLVEQGKLDLDRPLRETIPDVAIDNPWEAVAPVTLAQALEHTAGLDDMRPNDTFGDDDAATPSAALAINPGSRTIRWRPGTRMAYSNVGYTLAGRAIEVATGEPFDAWLRREVLVPLGMRDADFRRTPLLASRLATGYVRDGSPARFRPIPHRPAGALLASASDLGKLVSFWLRRGDGVPPIVSRAGLDRIERTGTVPYPRTDVEYGLGNYGDVTYSVRGRGHDGGLTGFASTYRYFPDAGVGFAVLFNATRSWQGEQAIRALCYAYVMRGRAVSAPAVTAASAPPAAEFFAFGSPRHALYAWIQHAVIGWRARERDDARIAVEELDGDAVVLVPSAYGGYRAPHESGTSTQFTRAADGTPLMLTQGHYAEAAPYALAHVRATAIRVALVLLQLAPLWLVLVLLAAVVRRRRVVAFGLALWPAVAGLCLEVFPRLLDAAATRQVLGERNALTVAACATTIVFAVAAAVGAALAWRWALRPDRPTLANRLVPTVTALAALAFAFWGAANGFIGLRIWAY